jgi:hypothetical protein
MDCDFLLLLFQFYGQIVLITCSTRFRGAPNLRAVFTNLSNRNVDVVHSYIRVEAKFAQFFKYVKPLALRQSLWSTLSFALTTKFSHQSRTEA